MELPRLKPLRIRAVLSQVELAAKSGVSEATIRRIEAGHPARYGNVRKLAVALGVEPADLMGLSAEGVAADVRPRADADAQPGTANEVEGYT